MENASKALLMGAGTLLAILIIFIAVRIFSSASDVTEAYQTKEVSSEVAAFNTNFTRFVGAVVINGELDENQHYAKIHDVVSVSNFAWNYNNKVTQNPLDPDDERIIRINIISEDGKTKIDNLQNYTQKAYNELINAGYYVVNSNPNANNTINYEIKIKRRAADGRINNVDFIPSSMTLELQNTIKNITKDDKYTRKGN